MKSSTNLFRTRRILPGISLVLAMIVLLMTSGCGGKSIQSALPAQDSFRYATNSSRKEEVIYDQSWEMETVASSAQSVAGLSGRSISYAPADEYAADGAVDLSALKLVYTGNLSMETLDYDRTVEDLRNAIRAFSGIVEYEKESTGSTYWYRSGADRGFQSRSASFTIRIPAASFYPFLDQVSGVGVVTNKDINVDNITRRYNDTAAIVEALRKEEARLLEMMELADSVEGMIAVEKRLSEVERDLNTYQTSLSGMDLNVSYSTVVLNIREVERIKETEPVSFGTRLANTFFESLEDFSAFCQDLINDLLYLLPFLLLILLILWLVVALIKRHRRRKAMKKEARAKAREEKTEEAKEKE